MLLNLYLQFIQKFIKTQWVYYHLLHITNMYYVNISLFLIFNLQYINVNL